MSYPCRVILLLDLDCFYAQCERVRLGLPPDTCLALLQWDSALAVTYPARNAYKIKRGDSWSVIGQKSNNKCLAIHLPVLTKADAAASSSETNEEESVEDAYQRMYCLLPEEQAAVRQQELGVRRYADEGKACLERYRIASARIFSVVLETLQTQLGKDDFVMERASIDELFLDITKYCWENETVDKTHIMGETVQVGQTRDESNDEEDDPLIRNALERGCLVAHEIRKAIFDTLGFTLSAGISTSKLVAKLGASYGKPNGQAIILPSAIPHVMDETEIRKVRNLGGKVGKQVQALLQPGSATTMGSIARQLSLLVLSQKLGAETGKMVFDACRGMDDEPVKETVGALVKSITAFKSFHKTSITSGEVTEWIALLAADVVSRVQLDATRNNRYPKSCTIQFTCSKESLTEQTGRMTKSVRIPFPRDGDVKAKLVQRAKDAVVAKEGKVFLYRFGLCAVDFQAKMVYGGISSFFVTKSTSSPAAQQMSKETVSTSETTLDGDLDNDVDHCQRDEDIARKLQVQYKSNLKAVDTPVVRKKASITKSESKAADKDMELAKKLQAQYDRENYVLTTAEKRAAHKLKSRAASKKQRIDTFFRKS